MTHLRTFTIQLYDRPCTVVPFECRTMLKGHRIECPRPPLGCGVYIQRAEPTW